MVNKNSENRFDPRRTKTIIIHDGRFHADDMMFAALAIVAAEKHKNKLEIKRLGNVPEEYDETIVVGDVGLGVYDHHIGLNNEESLGIQGKDKEKLPASCGLLYQDVKNILFPGASETKQVFEAFLDIIEHCDNTPDNNTFSDSINFFAPIDESKTDEMAQIAISYCKAVVVGFVEAHEKEKGGKSWAVPKVCSGIVPGIESKKDERYFKATNQIKNRYKYISFSGEESIKLRSMDTYSLACGVLNQRKRQYWRSKMEENDQLQLDDIERREKEDWPKALADMKHLTIYLDKYIPYGKYVKELNALFIVMPSQRGGYTVTPLKTNTGKYRFDPTLLAQCEGCTFTANDNRFVYFDTKENALKAAHTAGMAVKKYFETTGFYAYRDIYGGCVEEYTNNLYQDLLSEDIALCMYARDIIENPNCLSVDEYRMLQIAVHGNPYLIHSFCVHFDNDGENMIWKTDLGVLEVKGVSNQTLWTKDRNNRKWDAGVKEFLNTPKGSELWNKVFPGDN
jgi:uncharacterized UPF0160 family protein